MYRACIARAYVEFRKDTVRPGICGIGDEYVKSTIGRDTNSVTYQPDSAKDEIIKTAIWRFFIYILICVVLVVRVHKFLSRAFQYNYLGVAVLFINPNFGPILQGFLYVDKFFHIFPNRYTAPCLDQNIATWAHMIV